MRARIRFFEIGVVGYPGAYPNDIQLTPIYVGLFFFAQDVPKLLNRLHLGVNAKNVRHVVVAHMVVALGHDLFVVIDDYTPVLLTHCGFTRNIHGFFVKLITLRRLHKKKICRVIDLQSIHIYSEFLCS
jgi:hypothetical protein